MLDWLQDYQEGRENWSEALRIADFQQGFDPEDREELVEKSAIEAAKLYTEALAEFRALGEAVTVDSLTFEPIQIESTRYTQITNAAASVPEPSTFVLAALGLLGLAVCARRRRK